MEKRANLVRTAEGNGKQFLPSRTKLETPFLPKCALFFIIIIRIKLE